MLLTGYDVPVVQVMYLDKLLTEHNLLQAIARVNRTRDGKEAGFIVDYCGITRHLSKALAMFSDDLKPGEVMEKTDAEISRLENRHRQLTAFFNPVKIDRKKQRAAYIDKAVQHLEPEDLRDEFKLLLKSFNKSVNILLPSTAALKYEYDFILYNEIKYQAANTYVDDSLRVTKGESRKIQQLVDDHLTASGIRYLLEKPVSIIDREKFDEEIGKSFGPDSQLLKRLNRIKHTIKINLHKDPEFYKPLSERLEKLIAAHKEGRLKQMELFKVSTEIEGAIINKDSEGSRLGFSNEGEFAVYNTLKKYFSENAETITRTLVHTLAPELGLADWPDKEQVQKTMRAKIKKNLAGKIPYDQKESLSKNIVDVLKHNRKTGESTP
jgi:type I restriction enzyme R subunit